MANPGFGELALQYVLADEREQELAIADKAATIIKESSLNRITIGQWAASVNRWVKPEDDSADDDIISRAKALDFLASTLQALKSSDTALKKEQIKLLVSFFGSLFASDHRAGVSASAKALGHLVSMATFEAPLGNEIIQSTCKLGEDFLRQTPATRLELYELFLKLLQDPSVTRDLDSRHGVTCEFMTSLLELCQNERDPQNLMKWFETLKLFLQSFSPSASVTEEAFKSFSAYFPISIRASAAPTGITADDLKGALRSCFAAHHRVAGLAIPYLLNKLDQGDAVTVAVKVDILQTLDACLIHYDNPKQSVVPYADQIWSSLKYEVRNGEVQDAVKATLKAIGTLVQRLDTEELQSFVTSAWRDLAEDLSNPTYSAQAGRLLTAIVGATVQSFAITTPQALTLVQSNVKNTKSASQQEELLALLNSILIMRCHLIDRLGASRPESEDTPTPLNDELFGDTLLYDLYLPLWQDNVPYMNPNEKVRILKQIMEGVSTLVRQKSSSAGCTDRLCSDMACHEIFSWLARPVVICPIENTDFSDLGVVDRSPNQELSMSASAALKTAVPLYPPAFQQLLLQFLSSAKTAYKNKEQEVPSYLSGAISLVADQLCEVASSWSLDSEPQLSKVASLINAFLEGLIWMLSEKASPKYWVPFIRAIHLAVMQYFPHNIPSRRTSHNITEEWYCKFVSDLEDTGAPRVDLDNSGNLELATVALEGLQVDDVDAFGKILAYFLWVIQQLYRRFTAPQRQGNDTDGHRWVMGLSKDFRGGDRRRIEQEDSFLQQLGYLASTIVRNLDENEQIALHIYRDAFNLCQIHGVSGPEDFEVDIRDPSGILGISPMDSFRTAPLSLGILQGLYPGAMSPTHHLITLGKLSAVLVSTPLPCSDTTRHALDATLLVLTNRLPYKSNELAARTSPIRAILTDTFIHGIFSRNSGMDASSKIRIFHSILAYLAGDVARFQLSNEGNDLLEVVWDIAISENTMGRHLAQSFDILVQPKKCLDPANHAIRKRLSGEWLFYRIVQPRLAACFPRPPDIDERQAVNRAVATFAILPYLNYNQYASHIGEIVRVGIRSLSTFKIGVEMECCLFIFLCTLEEEPSELKEHLAGLISGMTAVYEMARNVAMAAQYLDDPRELDNKGRGPIPCRKMTLDFFRKLPSVYEAPQLVPYRQQLLRPLAMACGDPVREVRQIALKAREAWQTLA